MKVRDFVFSMKSAVVSMQKYLRFVDYLSAAQLYLKDNFLLEYPLQPEHIKERILGHWGTVPGLNFIYAHLNGLIHAQKQQMLFVVGPGHGVPGVLANLFAEGTLQDFYPALTLDAKGIGALIHRFSWPGGFPSHSNPGTPGTILEGGELGYSLSTSYGAVFDNPDLIAACVVGDGEAETGPLAASWQSNKFLNPKTSGAVLPIVHVNGYKISGPTLYGRMSDAELRALFTGYGYEPLFVEGDDMNHAMMTALQSAYAKIRAVQKSARAGKKIVSPRWPMIILRSLKGWTGIKSYHGVPIEGSFHAHGIPLEDPAHSPERLALLEKWLRSYRFSELLDGRGVPRKEVFAQVPKGDLRMGKNPHAFGGKMRKLLVLPGVSSYSVSPAHRGEKMRSTEIGAQFIRDVMKKNKNNFRFFCPDETGSNKMSAVFEASKRAFLWPLTKNDENMDPEGRVMEILSEHTLQGWLQGYLLTGRHGIFSTYEAFATIVTSMVDQYAKFIKQSMRVSWRKPVSSLNYILTSLEWEQEHNGFSHQNPGFVSSVLEKHGAFCSAYFPADANSLLVTLEDCLKRTNSINLIVAGKQKLPQWISLADARAQLKTGVGVWEWASPSGTKNPDVVLAAAGDFMTQECLAAIDLLHTSVPQLKVRFVNVSELTSLGIGDERHPLRLQTRDFEKYFTKDRPIIFNFHGYPDVIKKLVWNHPAAQRFSIHGYQEEGTTTTPFDMQVRNKTSRYHLAIEALQFGALRNPAVKKVAAQWIHVFQKTLADHQKYILEYGKDPIEISEWQWKR